MKENLFKKIVAAPSNGRKFRLSNQAICFLGPDPSPSGRGGIKNCLKSLHQSLKLKISSIFFKSEIIYWPSF